MQEQISSGDDEKSLKILTPRRQCGILLKGCEELNWNHLRSTPDRSETHGIAERAFCHHLQDKESREHDCCETQGEDG